MGRSKLTFILPMRLSAALVLVLASLVGSAVGVSRQQQYLDFQDEVSQ